MTNMVRLMGINKGRPYYATLIPSANFQLRSALGVLSNAMNGSARSVLLALLPASRDGGSETVKTIPATPGARGLGN